MQLHARSTLLLAATFCALSTLTAADPRLCPSIADQIKGADAAKIKRLLDFSSSNIGCLVFLAEDPSVGYEAMLRAIEKFRSDKQPGSGSASEGGTNLVAKGIVAKTLSVATEYGALTQSTKGQITTFRGNLAGLPSALIGKDVFPYCDPRYPKLDFCVDQSVLGWLRRISFGISFDTSRNETISVQPSPGVSPAANTIPGSFQAKSREVSMVSGRVELWNKRDVSSKKYVEKWKAKLASSEVPKIGKELTLRYEDLAQRLEGVELAAWLTSSVPAIMASMRNSVHDESVIADQIELLLKRLIDKNIVTKAELLEMRALLLRFGFSQDEIIDTVGSSSVLALEYTNNRPLAQSPTSTFRGILEMPSWKKWSLTANSAFTIFDIRPTGQSGIASGRLRDIQFAAQMERPLGDFKLLGTAALSVAYYYQQQKVAAALNVDPANPLPGVTFINIPVGARTIFAEKGDIQVGQIRLTLGSNGSVRYPIALSYSSRTELINRPAWRAQIGVSYDFDSLFMKK